MIISDLELASIELPASDGRVRTLLVRIGTNVGLEGWGETRLQVPRAMLAARAKSLLASLSGRDAHDIESILALDVLANRALACGVEMALWDLIARQARVPLCQLFGGAYRPSVPIAVRLPPGEAETVADWARAMATQGIGTQTIVSSGDLAKDVQQVTAAVDACADHVQFHLDAACRYEPTVARQLCRELPQHQLAWVLDPVPENLHDRLDHWHEGVALAAGRSIQRATDVFVAGNCGSFAAVQIDPIRVGGLLRARECAAVAHAAGLSVSLSLEGTSGLAVAAGVQLAAATLSLGGALECSFPKLHDDLLLETLRSADGQLGVPMTPGLGVEVHRDKIERYAAGR